MCIFIFGKGGGSGSGPDLSKVTARPEYVLSPYKYVDKGGVLRTGTIPNYAAPAAGASGSPDKLTLLPEVNAARHIPAGVYMSKDVEIGPLAGNIPFISNGGIPGEGESVAPIYPDYGPSTDPDKVSIFSSGSTRHYPAGIYLDHDLELKGINENNIITTDDATVGITAEQMVISNLSVIPVFVMVVFRWEIGTSLPNGYIQTLGRARNFSGISYGGVLKRSGDNEMYTYTASVTWGDDSITLPRQQIMSDYANFITNSNYGYYEVWVTGIPN